MTDIMRKITLLSIFMLVAGCQGGIDKIDPQKFLAGLEGPKIPTMQDTLTQQAQAAEKQGNFKEAIDLYQQVLQKHPDNKAAALSLADCYRRNGEYDQAIVMYDQLLKEDDNNINAKEGKGLSLLAKGDFQTPGKLF